jgi:hypothetical protein
MALNHRDHLARPLMRGVCSAKAALLSAEFAAWQNVQSLPMELAKVPITSKNVSRGNAAQQLDGLEGFFHHRHTFARVLRGGSGLGALGGCRAQTTGGDQTHHDH